MNAQPALDDYLRDLLGADAAPAPAPIVAAPVATVQVMPPASGLERTLAAVPGAPACSREDTAAGDDFDAAHEDVLERLLATTRGIAVADDPEAILALRRMEALPVHAPAIAPAVVPDVENPSLPETGETAMTSVEATPAKSAAPAASAGDLITDDEFEALLDHLHGGAAPGARTMEAPASPAPPPASPPRTAVPAVPASAPSPVPVPAPTAPFPAAAIPAYAKPVFDLLQRRHHDDTPASSPHGERRRAGDRSTRWLRMRCDEQHYALELLKVQEVVLPATLLPLRGAAAHMLGVMNLRGQVVPVLDLGLYLGRAAITPDSHVRIVVLEENGEILGLRVSAVEDVTSLTEQQIEPPDNTRMCRITHPLFRGVARLAGRTVILLDASELLR